MNLGGLVDVLLALVMMLEIVGVALLTNQHN
jgi:hypothetical protein